VRGRCAETLLWVAGLTSCNPGAPRSVVHLSDLQSESVAGAGFGEQSTSMSDSELDRVLEFLTQTGHVGGVREPGVGCTRWRMLRLRPSGLTAIGEWPPAEDRYPLPTGCALWDGRDAPLLGHVAAHGPLDVVACRPTGAPEGVLFRDLPLTPVDGYWSLVALRDAELVSGDDRGPAGWQHVRATDAGIALAGLMAAQIAPSLPAL
jgi:hypothetical protein